MLLYNGAIKVFLSNFMDIIKFEQVNKFIFYSKLIPIIVKLYLIPALTNKLSTQKFKITNTNLSAAEQRNIVIETNIDKMLIIVKLSS